MKTRNVDLKNTPLLSNHICKNICLKAPSIQELKKKVKEYEILLVRSLTNAYQLTSISLDRNGEYTLLEDGNYQTSMFFNFSGIKKDLITNPEKTLQYIKHLTAMESKPKNENAMFLRTKQKVRSYHKTVSIPIEFNHEEVEADVISAKQRDILEKLVLDTNLINATFTSASKIRGTDGKIKSISLKMDYDAKEFIEIPEEHSIQDDEENR